MAVAHPRRSARIQVLPIDQLEEDIDFLQNDLLQKCTLGGGNPFRSINAILVCHFGADPVIFSAVWVVLVELWTPRRQPWVRAVGHALFAKIVQFH